MTAFDKYIDDTPTGRRIAAEKRLATAVVDAILKRGFRVSVYDGEGWAVRRSNYLDHILKELFATDEDYIHIRTETNAKVGWFHLVYGNSGWDLISDYSDNEVCNDIWAELQPLIQKLEHAA